MISFMFATCMILTFATSPQEDYLQTEIDRRILEMSSEKPETRQKATEAVQALGPSAIEILEEKFKTVTDADLGLRIRAIIKQLWIRKSGRLFSEYKLDEALLAMASAENPAGPVGYRKKRLEEAKAALEALVETDRTALIKTVGPRHCADELREKYGRWMLPVLLDRFHPDARVDHGEDIDLLKQWGGDAIPALISALKSNDDRYLGSVIWALHGLGRGYPEVRYAFQQLYQDDARSVEVRKLARALFIDLGGTVEK